MNNININIIKNMKSKNLLMKKALKAIDDKIECDKIFDLYNEDALIDAYSSIIEFLVKFREELIKNKKNPII
jgi:hypothetical protein